MILRSSRDRLVQDVEPLARDADDARDTGDWDRAARLYEEIVRLRPTAAAAWMQLGHAHKEAGRLDPAQDAYEHARTLQPADLDTALQLGHLHKLRGNVEAAAEHYSVALAGGLDDEHARHFLDTMEHPGDEPDLSPKAGLYFDFTDLIAYFRNNRLPTGIQRVQMKLWQALISRSGGMPAWGCVFSERADAWVLLDPVVFTGLCNLTARPGTADDPDWRGTMGLLDQRTAKRRALRFPPGSALINFGTSWGVADYFGHVRDARARHGLRYVQLVYDLIPLITPNYVAPTLTDAFAGWASGVAMHADVVAAISCCTARDVAAAAAAAGMPIAPPIIVPLDADFEEGAQPLGEAEVRMRLDRLGLGEERFVLFVGTLEARKNQLLAFQGWSRLLEGRGGEAIPTLVCVGKQGHGFDALEAMLEARPGLKEKVVLLSGLADADLRALYSGCLFTVYTSTYEGWGLPVTESLCHGKTCLAGNHSSLPEAGGPFVAYYEADSVISFVEQARRLLFEPEVRREMEARIQSGFKPRQWSQVLAAFIEQLEARLAALPPPGPPVAPARLGTCYRFGTGGARRISRAMATAEAMRAGGSWFGVEDWGMWSRKPVARLRLDLEPGPWAGQDVVVYLTMRSEWPSTKVVIRVGTRRLAEGEMPMGRDKQLVATIPAELAWPEAGQPLVLQIAVAAMSPLSVMNAMDTRMVGFGMIDITLCAAGDLASRLAAVERAVMIVG